MKLTKEQNERSKERNQHGTEEKTQIYTKRKKQF
jgi:hypothetical protein